MHTLNLSNLLIKQQITIMKKLLYFTLSMFFFLSITSCSQSSDLSVIEKDDFMSVNNYNKFLNTVDSINAKYLLGSTTTRGKDLQHYIHDKKLDKVADAGGSIVGGWIGKNVGLTLGYVTGNPVVGAVGYWGGRWVGRAVGSFTASFIAYKYSGSIYHKIFHSPQRANDISMAVCDTVPSFVYSASNETPSLEDSLGYIHNQVMEALMLQEDKYVVNGNIDYEQIYNDCVTLAKQYGIENDTITGSQEYKNAVLDYAKKMAQLTYEACVDTAKYENFYNKAAETLERAKIPEETVSLFKDYVVKVSKTCDNLTEAQQKEYAKELFDAIENSELQKEAKEEVTSTTNVLINSSIYWDKQ